MAVVKEELMNGKTDMERVGLFKEQKYHTIGDNYPKVNIYLFVVCFLFVQKS